MSKALDKNTAAMVSLTLNEISIMASSISDFAVAIQQNKTISESESMLVAINKLADQVGYFADLAGEDIDGGPIEKDAENRFCSPMYLQHKEEKRAQYVDHLPAEQV